MPFFLPPFLLGLVVAPLAKRVVKPLVRGTVKTSLSLAMEMKKAAHQASEELHDLTAEVGAEMFNTDLQEAKEAGSKSTKGRVPAGAGSK